MHLKTADIRQYFTSQLQNDKFTQVNREGAMTKLVGNKTLELLNANFIADEPAIFGELNHDYIAREEQWYNSQSLNVYDIPGGPPQIWRSVADADGFINSNYGWCIYSAENGHQFQSAVQELRKNPESRRAEMIYTRPQMWQDYNKNGRQDFMCTNCVQYLVRDGAVHAVVQMRSNDSIFGFKNDRAWQQHVLELVAAELQLPCGTLYWNVGSLHIYSRHFYLVHHYSISGELHITKEQYQQQYPDSKYI